MNTRDETPSLRNNGKKLDSLVDHKSTTKSQARKSLFKFAIILIAIFSLTYVFYIKYYQSNKQTVENTNQTEEINDDERLVCDRTTRLENDPNIERALSLIHERLTEYGDDDSLFSPQLVNCIKVEVKHIKNDTGAEGYFDENNDDIKSNYFPIVIDDLGNFFADDLSTALLLVHEITHVQQYIDRYNFGVDPTYSDSPLRILSKMTKSKCLDNEVFAYKNQLLFTLKLKDEERKLLNYRVMADEHPIPQIELLGSLQSAFQDFSYANSCKEKFDVDCVDRSINIKIYDALRDSGIYDEQCSIYEGTFIGE
jgi:hypothetical protein